MERITARKKQTVGRKSSVDVLSLKQKNTQRINTVALICCLQTNKCYLTICYALVQWSVDISFLAQDKLSNLHL